MTQIILNVEDVNLVPGLKQILGAIKGVTIDKLTNNYSIAEEEKQMVADTITKGYNQAKEGKFAGENLSSLDALVSELRTETEQSMVTFNVTDTCINLLTIYDKKEFSNVSDRYIDEIIRNL